MKSHIDQVALDNLSCESSDTVQYARNDRMGQSILYEYMGIDHAYAPYFLVRLAKRRDRGAGAFHVCRNPQLLDKEMEYLAHTLRGEP